MTPAARRRGRKNGDQSPPRLRPRFLYSAGDQPESFVATLFSHLFARRGRLLGLAALMAFLASACGRYGPLEPPPNPNAPPKPANANPANPAGVFAKPSIPPIKAPDQPFFLDFLLK
jgi:predicted small lipoprotein YifL